jgi:hypothetical protein
MEHAFPVAVALAVFAAACAVDSDSTDVDIDEPEVELAPQGVPPGPDPGDIQVTVIWNVIRTGTAASQGNISDARIATQIAKLNQDFVAPSFYFTLKGVTRTTNVDWFNAIESSAEEYEMKNELRQGSAKTLNIYSLDYNGGLQLGWANVPIEYFDDPEYDGVVIYHASVSGGSAVPYALGNQLTTYVGRWLGLEWVWNGGCVTSGSAGDYVADTPAQASAAWGCPTGRNSCPGQTGNDAIHNYMQWTDDVCRTNFTPGQRSRMADQWDDFRADN